jgi:putative endonuclease
MAFMYILECANGKFYTGSTKYLVRRLEQHKSGQGANYTRKHGPVRLLYTEPFCRVQDAFYREKQIQGWSHKKKQALIDQNFELLHNLAECQNETHSSRLRSTSSNCLRNTLSDQGASPALQAGQTDSGQKSMFSNQPHIAPTNPQPEAACSPSAAEVSL